MGQLRLSEDGLYYWDGKEWVTTLSNDGRTRWNGTAWVPVTSVAAMPPPGYQYPQRQSMVRVPSSWTKPLQYGVTAYYALSAIYVMSIHFLMSGPLKQIVDRAVQQSYQRDLQIDPNFPPPSAQYISGLESVVTSFLWIGAVLGVAIASLVIVGALRRWVWVYWVVLVLLGLGAIGLPINLATAIAGGSPFTGGLGLPTWLYWLSVAVGVPGTALFVWMLVALIRRGPWGMPKISSQTAAGAPPVSGAASPAN